MSSATLATTAARSHRASGSKRATPTVRERRRGVACSLSRDGTCRLHAHLSRLSFGKIQLSARVGSRQRNRPGAGVPCYGTLITEHANGANENSALLDNSERACAQVWPSACRAASQGRIS
eukprot:SAG11_NODE_2636_length_3149_cov_1.681639_4_plen_121_part_00